MIELGTLLVALLPMQLNPAYLRTEKSKVFHLVSENYGFPPSTKPLSA